MSTVLRRVSRRRVVSLAATSALVALWVTGVLLSPVIARMSVRVFFSAIAVSVLLTAATCVAVTAVLPPLRPIGEVSILGKRLSDFLKVGIAIAAFFGTTTLGWIVSKTYDEARTSAEVTAAFGSIGQILLFIAVGAAITYWWWLPVDLFRSGGRRRRGAINFLFRRAVPRLEQWGALAVGRFARRTAIALTSEWWWIAGAFYIVPLLGLSGAAAVTSGME